GVAEGRLSGGRSRRDGTHPLAGDLFRRSRAGGLLAGQYRPGYRLLAGQDAAGSTLLVRRRPALSAGHQLQPYSGQCTAMPIPLLSPRRRDADRRQSRRDTELLAQQQGRMDRPRPGADGPATTDLWRPDLVGSSRRRRSLRAEEHTSELQSLTNL